MRWSDISLWFTPFCSFRAVEMAMEVPERKKKMGAQKRVMKRAMKGRRSAFR